MPQHNTFCGPQQAIADQRLIEGSRKKSTTCLSQLQAEMSQLDANNRSQQLMSTTQQQQQQPKSNNQGSEKLHTTQLSLRPSTIIFNPPNPYSQPSTTETSESLCKGPSFVVTWRNLRFAIEPKWHQRVFNANSMSALTGRTAENATNRQLPNQITSHQLSNSTAASKLVLDKLDGSFKSGELTAILGPSGKFGRES